MKSGLSHDALAQISAILETVSSVDKAVLFGSRAMGLARANSDVDIMLYGDGLKIGDMMQINSLLEETSLPYQFDLIRYDANNTALLEHVRQYGKVIFWRGKSWRKGEGEHERGRLGMGFEWKIEPLREVVSYIAKGIPPAYAEYENETTIRVLNQKCNRDFAISYAESRLHDLSKRSVSQEKYLRDEDILINSTGTGTAGRVAQLGKVPSPTIVDGHMIVLRPNDKLEPLYLGYALKAHQREILQLDEGSTGQTELNRERLLSEIMVSYPISIIEQRAIANTLSVLDAKIAINAKINRHLEQMAQAIFKSWFVDFDDVALGDMQESELGLIPNGWQWVPVSELIEFNPAEPLRKGTLAPYLDMAALPTIGSWPDPPIQREFGSGMRFRNGDTLLARITPCLENGKTAFVQCLPEDTLAWGSTEFIVMRPKAPIPAEYAYLLARNGAFREHAIKSMTGTSGRQRAQVDSVLSFKVALPPDEKIWKAFANLVSSIFRSIKANSEESETLTQLRDTLLPKLMSGELRVEDVGKVK